MHCATSRTTDCNQCAAPCGLLFSLNDLPDFDILIELIVCIPGGRSVESGGRIYIVVSLCTPSQSRRRPSSPRLNLTN